MSQRDPAQRSTSLWIAWQTHRRTQTLTEALNIPTVIIMSSSTWWVRYSVSIVKTVATLIRHRPRVLIVQNPSLLLSAMGVVWGKLRLSTTIVDAHNAGVTAWPKAPALIKWVTRFVLRNAHLTIVTNTQLANIVNQCGGRALVLPDRLPVFSHDSQSPAKSESCHVVFVCTYGWDEPVDEVVAAARDLPDVNFSITGKPGPRFDTTTIPDNVTLTGYLPDGDYIALLRSADLVVDLTTRDACLVCGGYEGVALEQPVLLSGNAAAKQLFPDALFCNNTAASIVDAVHQFRVEPDAWRSKSRRMKSQRESVQDQELAELAAFIQEHE